ncbi:group II intron reverse transcriptase/maturase [Leptolyngbya sp. NK1-12]|uniref:Group II intron reverse transcriptase/maturase n=1 Tax=Leptolyngbya sp. NK1-12 TaxID=2547451 RepID=A0AA96WQR8_9CYAN|nr:group II intron reverse transcriptase/maturase [Leptolyngbya sp. NK1-12]WNZ27636.1 group II intron reverse transcriptase/maturase [Leptolyngbya sp. NK1-12]
MSQSLNPIRYEWKDIPWKKIQVKIFKLQRRIYRASLSGDVKQVHRLQRLLMKSWYAKYLAVRRISQDNQGKKTAGVDGVKSLTPAQRFQLINSMDFKSRSRAVRRVWIPKPGKAEKRPLGIPTMHDRALQALLKLALEPEWEAKFEPNSYGFRPGRSAQDAIEEIHIAICQKSKFVLDADVAQCFDKINHDELLRKLNTFSLAGRAIRGWLKAGVMDGDNLFPTPEGVPQGGVISPLLANVALHGIETFILSQYPHNKKGQNWKPQLIRYADDFVVLHPDLKVVEECQTLISDWLKALGLELKPSKTRIVHTLNPVGEHQPGFDFLGFNVRSYPVGRTHSGKNNSKLTGFKTIIKPSKANIKAQYRKIAEHIESLKAAPQQRIIRDLNPAIRGWSNYYSTVSSKAIYSKLDFLLWKKLWRWAKFRHPKKGKRWIANRYWLIDKGEGWRFSDGKHKLLRHIETPIRDHIKVKGKATPYDGNWTYWSQRRGTYPGVSTTVSTAIKRQKGKCAECGLHFHMDDVIEIHHLDGNHRNTKMENLTAIHRHCHDRIHGGSGNLSTQLSTHVKGQSGEKPDERKRSRPVLKPSMGGDLHA